MNLLTDKAPTELVIDGLSYTIDTDFRTWIKLTNDFFLKEIDNSSIVKALCLVYRQIPPNPEGAVRALFDFYTMDSGKKESSQGTSSKSQLVFDFEKDAWLIYSSFYEQYGIDLQKADMHWWMFKSLFNTLSPQTAFGKVLHYRSADIGKIKDPEQRKHYRAMKKLYALPDNRSEAEKERDFADTLALLL